MENVTSDNLHVGNSLCSQDDRSSNPIEWENKSKRVNKNCDSENSNLSEEDNKLIKSEKRNYMIFSSILRYKKYLVKKGNNYFDFNQTNLQLNEKEMLVHSSNFYHLFDLKSLFFPHIYINVNSHININISDYVNFLKMHPCMYMDEGEKKDLSYNSKQEFILEAIQKVEHMEVFKQVMLVKKLFLVRNDKTAKAMTSHFDNIPDVNSNDYIFVQTNRKNDTLLGYIKGSKFNLFFEVFNFKRFFIQQCNANIHIDVYEIEKKKMVGKDSFFEDINGDIFMTEQIVREKRKDALKKMDIYFMYHYDYYFGRNSLVEHALVGETGEKHILSFNLCVRCVNSTLLLMVLYNHHNGCARSVITQGIRDTHDSRENSGNSDPLATLREELDMYSRQFDLNNVDKNMFKRNTFFVTDLYAPLQCKLLDFFVFTNFPVNDYIRHVYFTKLKKSGINGKEHVYTFTIYCLSNEGTLYILPCDLVLKDIYRENIFSVRVKKYYYFELKKQCTYSKIKVTHCSGKYLYALCSHSSFFNCKSSRMVERTTNADSAYEKLFNNICRFTEGGVQGKHYYDGTLPDERTNTCYRNLPTDKIYHSMEDEGNCGDGRMFPSENEPFPHQMNNVTTGEKKKDDEIYSRLTRYKYMFVVITSKCDFYVITLRVEKIGKTMKKKTGDMAKEMDGEKFGDVREVNNSERGRKLVNFSSTNSSNTDEIICNIVVNKYNYEKYSEQNRRSKSCTLFEILCFYKNGCIKKYHYICSLKNKQFEFSLVENERKSGSICRKLFFIPVLFPFNDEVLREKKKKKNTIILYNMEMSHYKSLMYIYFQENQYENISMTINEQCIIVNYVKAFSKLFKKVRGIRRYKWELHNESDFTNTREIVSSELSNKTSLNEKENFVEKPLFLESTVKKYMHCNLFTQREYSKTFSEFKYILFGFYDLFLINEKNIGRDIKEKENKMENNHLMNSHDVHSHFGLMNIIRDYITYDNVLSCVNDIYTKENNQKMKMKMKMKIQMKMNFYRFLQILIFFQNNYVEEYSSFFHLLFNLLNWEIYTSHKKNKLYKQHTPFDGYELIDIRNYCSILFCFFVHMYNFCLKQHGLSSGDFSSHITFFLINKKVKKNKKKFRYVYKYGEKGYREELAGQYENKVKNNFSMDGEINHQHKDNGIGERVGKIKEMEEHENLLTKHFTAQKCFYYVHKIGKYLHDIFNEDCIYHSGDHNILVDMYTNLYLCQILYTMLNTLRINNTNIFVNINYNVKKNNMDYIYILILLNFYGLFYFFILNDSILCIEKKKIEGKMYEEDRTIIEEKGLLQFYNEIYTNDYNKKRVKSKIIEIDLISFEIYVSLIYKIVIDSIKNINIDNYIVEKLYLKLNCLLCGKLCISNLYNNYYICQNKHIFNKCMLTFGCIYKNYLFLPSNFQLTDLSQDIYNEHKSTMNFNIRFKIQFIYFCSFCHYFITTECIFFKNNFLFKQCPFCNHELDTP
ncbi:conserved Plasmodium protein, unknown function [Plasmodium ovale]|nr:conserved Plasmodium protein, unknown function [Plasmodium ovale curtisi]SCQ17048.1 conserved Plasmodium protein, unknown function [Plasmodium ovale]